MQILVVLMLILTVAMSHIIPLIELEPANSLPSRKKSVNVGKELSFDDELQKLNLTSFRTLLVETELMELLNDSTEGSHTVFAPTNAVLGKVPAELLNNITRVKEILSYHVHNGSFETDRITKDMNLKTLLGGRKKIRFEIYFGVSQTFSNT